MSQAIQTHYTAEDITEETLEPFPELRALVAAIEGGTHRPTATEALLINVVVRQANAMYAQAQVVVGYALKYGTLRHDVVA